MKLTTQLKYNLMFSVMVWAAWISMLGPAGALAYIANNWEVTLTMFFGSFIAGATSGGGGTVAFPVFTKVLHITPQDAKVFSIAIQSVGMTTAALMIFLMKVKVEWRVIGLAGLGGILGISLGSIFLASMVPPDIIKMTFTMMVTSLGIALVVLNKKGHKCHQSLPLNSTREHSIILAGGMIGGGVTSLVGSGIDIITFSIMVLLFRMNEKVATPTTVVLMAFNSLVGLLLYGVFLDGINEVVFSYWMAAIPVVVIGAPLGVIVCVHSSRSIIVKVLLGLIIIELISSLVIIPLLDMTVMFSIATLLCSSLIFYSMCKTRRYETVFVETEEVK